MPNRRGARSTAALLFMVSLIPASAADQAPPEEPVPQFSWIDAPALAKMSDVAEIKVPENVRFAGADDARKFLEFNHNIPSGQEAGMLVGSIPGRQDGFWFAIFEWEPIGYVKDDERTSIDADALLKSITEGTEAANEERRKRGWNAMHIVGWQTPPKYDEATHNLTWAILGQSDPGGERSVNHRTRMLGRQGVMSVDLVVSPENYAGALPVFNAALGNYAFQSGKTYAEYKPGDTVAKVGLTALIVGGAGAVAAKTGLLAKFWKLIVAGLVALMGALKNTFSRLFGRKRDRTVEPVYEAPPPPEPPGPAPPPAPPAPPAPPSSPSSPGPE